MVKKFCFLCVVLLALSAQAQNKYKCMVQMTNYSGEAAYLKTLHVFGDNSKYYDALKKWYDFYTAKKEKVDALTGASITQGDRKTIVLDLDNKLLNQGYKLRFESAVEDQYYYTTDAEVPFTTESLKEKVSGTGYVRYVRLSEVK